MIEIVLYCLGLSMYTETRAKKGRLGTQKSK